MERLVLQEPLELPGGLHDDTVRAEARQSSGKLRFPARAAASSSGGWLFGAFGPEGCAAVDRINLGISRPAGCVAAGGRWNDDDARRCAAGTLLVR